MSLPNCKQLMSTTPIFLISQPRSGSTVLQAVLSNHHDVATSSEPWVQLLRLPLVSPERFSSRVDWPLVAKAAVSAGEKVGSEMLLDADECLIGLTRRYYGNAAAGSRYFLDKTPRYYYLLDRLFVDFPEARFLVLGRHPASIVRSIQKTWDIDPASDEMRYFADDLLIAPKLIHSFLQHHGDEDRVYSINYEEMVENPEGIIESVFSWLDLEFETALLEYGSNQKYQGELGDPNAGNRSRLVARKLPTRDAFLGGDVSMALTSFCRGLVDYHERLGLTVPFKDLWFCGRPSFLFDYYLVSVGLKDHARGGGWRRFLYWCERFRRRILRLSRWGVEVSTWRKIDVS